MFKVKIIFVGTLVPQKLVEMVSVLLPLMAKMVYHSREKEMIITDVQAYYRLFCNKT